MGRTPRGYELRQLPSGVWQVRFTFAGKRYEPSTEECDLDRAEAKSRQIYAAVISGRWTPGSELAAPGTPVYQVGAAWLDAIEPMVEPTTRRQYSYYVTAHWQPHFQVLDAFARPPMIPAYVRARLKLVRRKTLQKELSAMRNFLAWAHEVGHLPEKVEVARITKRMPGKPDERRRHKSVPIELSVADVEAILAALPEMSKGSCARAAYPVRDFYVVCYDTGLRPDATVAKLVPEDLRAGELAVREEIDKARFGRSVPLTPRAREALERHATRPGKLIFGKATRSPYLRAAALLAGKPGVSAYDFRHARATHLMESSKNNILGVGYLLGHTQATTTNRYAKQTHRAAKSVLEQMTKGDENGRDEQAAVVVIGAGPVGSVERSDVGRVDGEGHQRRGQEVPRALPRGDEARGSLDVGERGAAHRVGLPAQTSGVAPGSAGPVGDANGALSGTFGNATGAKEGNRTPTGVTPQEPDTSENAGERQGVPGRWERGSCSHCGHTRMLLPCSLCAFCARDEGVPVGRRRLGVHVHACPTCYRFVPCDEPCDTEPDLRLDDGTECGAHVECERCEARQRPAAKVWPAVGVSRGARPLARCEGCHGYAPAHCDECRGGMVLPAIGVSREDIERDLAPKVRAL